MNEDKSARYHRLKRRAGLASAADHDRGARRLAARPARRRAAAAAARAVAPAPLASTALYVLGLAAVIETGRFSPRLLSQLLPRTALRLVRRHIWRLDAGLPEGAGARSGVRHRRRRGRLLAAGEIPVVVVADVGGAVRLRDRVDGEPGSDAAAADVLQVPAARARIAALTAGGAVDPRRRPGPGRLRVGDGGEDTRGRMPRSWARGRTRRIILSDTLLAAYSEDEIEVVMAHELGPPRAPGHPRRAAGRIGAGARGFLLCGVGPERVLADPGSDVAGGRCRPAAVAAGRRRDHASRHTARERPLAAQRTACRRLRARHDGAAGRIHLGDEAAGRAEPRGRESVARGALAVPQPSADGAANRGRAATRATFNVQRATLMFSVEPVCTLHVHVARSSTLSNDELPFHPAAPVVLRQVAVEAVGADLVGAEFERDALPGGRAFGDAVIVDGEAVGDVAGGEGDLDQVVLLHLEAQRREGELVPRDGELPRRTLGANCRRMQERAGEQAGRHARSRQDAVVLQVLHRALVIGPEARCPPSRVPSQRNAPAQVSATDTDARQAEMVLPGAVLPVDGAHALPVSALAWLSSGWRSAFRLSRILPEGSMLITLTITCSPSLSSSRTSLTR